MPNDTTPAPIVADALREGASYESMNLAAMVLSDCGHSSNYEPLLERVAGRIDRHVERLLTAQREALTVRAQAAPAALAGPSTEQQAAVFREYLNVHEVGGSIGGHAMDAMALDLARIVDALRSRARTNASGQRGEDVAQFVTAARAAKEGA